MKAPKPEQSATRSIGLVGLVNVGTTIVGVIQAFVIGGIFGTSSSIEIYFAAVVFYQSIVNLMQTGQIAEVFTPIYHRLKESHGEQTAFEFLAVLTNWMVLIAVFCSIIVFWAADYLVPLTVPGFDEDRVATCISMFRWIVPVLALQILAALLATLFSAEKYFVFQEIVRLICLIISLLVVVLFSSTFDAWVMVYALWAASIGTLVFFFVQLVRIGYRHSFALTHTDFSVGAVFKSTPSIFTYVLVTQVYSIALTAGLSTLPQGSLAVFSYAQRIFVRINGTVMRPITAVFFTHYSSALAAGSEMVSKLALRALRITLFAAGLAAIAVFASAYPGLRAIWLGDKFPAEAIFQTYVILSILCIIPFFSGLGGIFRKINMSHQLVKPQYFYLTGIQIISAVMAYYLIPMWGLAGAVLVAVANPVMMTAVSGLLLRTKASSAFSIYQPRDVFKCLMVIAVSVAPALVLQSRIYGSGEGLAGGKSSDFLLALALLTLSTTIAFLAGLIFRVEEVGQLLRFGRNMLIRSRKSEIENAP